MYFDLLQCNKERNSRQEIHGRDTKRRRRKHRPGTFGDDLLYLIHKGPDFLLRDLKDVVRIMIFFPRTYCLWKAWTYSPAAGVDEAGRQLKNR
jgi:hypothetical protein